MNSKQIQYLLDRNNFVDLSAGTHLITEPIQLGHLTGDVIIQGKGGASYLVYRGPAGRTLFEFNKTGNQESPSLFFRNFKTQSGAGYSGGRFGTFKVISPNTSPKSFSVFNCTLTSKNSYCLDVKNGASIDFIDLRCVRFNCSGGAIRWRIRQSDRIGYVLMKTIRHQTGSKIGPAFDFKNLGNIIGEHIIDEQNCNIYTELKNKYFGPVSTRLINPRNFNLYRTHWNEYWTNTGEFPGCWIGEVRVEDDAQPGQYHVQCDNSIWTHSNSVGYSTLIAGNNSGPGLIFDGTHKFDPGAGILRLAGKSWSRFTRGYFKGGYEDISGVFDAQVSGSFRFPSTYQEGNVNGGGIPSKNIGGIQYNRFSTLDRYNIYEASGNYENTIINRSAPDYEDILWQKSQIAFGGFMYETSGHIVHEFLENGNLIVNNTTEIEYLLVGGGGPGGKGNGGGTSHGAGGGGGGVITNFEGTKITLTPGTYPIIIGQGGIPPLTQFGLGDNATGSKGGNTIFNGLIAYGGGAGGGRDSTNTDFPGGDGGCGGGTAFANVSGVASPTGQGYDGGGRDPANGSGASGGGGAGEPGGANRATNLGGHGGDGLRSLITGSSVYYGGGGGGGVYASGAGNGGLGGGGTPENGGNYSWGTYGLGGGGGGTSGGGRRAGKGGSGRVIIRYIATPAS